jgi:hypothetical protein
VKKSDLKELIREEIKKVFADKPPVNTVAPATVPPVNAIPEVIALIGVQVVYLSFPEPVLSVKTLFGTKGPVGNA